MFMACLIYIMNFTQLRAFDMVVREGSFTRAAEQLSVTQPALTIQVKALEEFYATRLLDRSGRTVMPTADGKALFDITRRLFALEEEARELLTDSNELRRGHLKIAADGPHIVMNMFARFRERYPNVQLHVTLGNTAFVRQQLVERHVDIGVMPNIEDDPAFVGVPLWQHTPVLIVPLSHPWTKRRTITVRELDNQPLVIREDGSNTQRRLNIALQREGIRPDAVLQLGSREAILGAVAAGLGFGVVWQVEAIDDARFHMIVIKDNDIRSTDYVACLKGERNRGVVKAMMTIAKDIHKAGAVI